MSPKMITYRMNVALDNDGGSDDVATPGTEFLRTDDTSEDICAELDSSEKIEVEA